MTARKEGCGEAGEERAVEIQRSEGGSEKMQGVCKGRHKLCSLILVDKLMCLCLTHETLRLYEARVEHLRGMD